MSKTIAPRAAKRKPLAAEVRARGVPLLSQPLHGERVRCGTPRAAQQCTRGARGTGCGLAAAPPQKVDKILEQAKEVTRRGKYTYLEYARFADDLVILVDASAQHNWLLGAVVTRLREALAVLHVTINDDKSRMVDLAQGESFGCVGVTFRRVCSRSGAWRPLYTPQLKKRTALLRKLRTMFRRARSQPIERVIHAINPLVRGWVHDFAMGTSSRCLQFVQDWVEKKVRRHLMRARKRRGFGWKRWRRR